MAHITVAELIDRLSEMEQNWIVETVKGTSIWVWQPDYMYHCHVFTDERPTRCVQHKERIENE